MKPHNHGTPQLPPELEGMLSFHPPKYYETYIKLASRRIIFVNEDFTKQMASELTALLLHYDNVSQEDITIYINSNGGDAHGLTAVQDTLSLLRSKVITVCLGRAYSAGAFLLASGTKGKRYALKHSQILIHGLQVIFPSPQEPQVDESDTYYQFLETINNTLMKTFSKQTGQTLAQVKQDCSRDFFLTAKEALEYGIIDEILG